MGKDNLRLPVCIRKRHFEGKQKTVELRLGKRESPCGMGVVLCRDDHERPGQLAGHPVDGNIALVHAFQQRGLHPRGGAVDLIRKQAVGKNGTGYEIKISRRGAVEIVAEEVRRKKIRGELNPLERSSH